MDPQGRDQNNYSPHPQDLQQQPQLRNPPSRLHLNFGLNEHNFAADAGRAFPTTPSTFPQPVYSNQFGQKETWGAQTPSAGYGNAGYFMNNPYQALVMQQQAQQQQGQHQQAQQQQAQQQQAQQQQLQQQQMQQQQSQQPQQQQPPQTLPNGGALRSPTSYNDMTNGLAQQFAHQNLGGNPPRSDSPYGRQHSPANRLRQPPPQQPQQQQQHQYGTHLMPGQNGVNNMGDEELPLKNPEKYSDNVYKRAKVSTELVGAFFKENVQRARDRNQRTKELDQYLQDPSVPEARKEQKRNNLRRAEAQYLRFLRTKEKATNFATVKIIGKGAFGEVKLVQRKTDGKIYALKSLVKSEMYKRDQLAHVRAERDIMAESDSPWVVKLHTTFQDASFLYMLMEFLPGGDLMTMLIKYEIFTEDVTRFYMAELVLAIEAVHKLGFIHRDIKPDNILLDRGGHLKLSDFGLSTGFHKEHDQSYYQQLIHGKAKSSRDNRQSVTLDQIQLTVSNRGQVNTWRKSRRQLAYSTVGTPDYIAPEIFSGRGYDFACDWWSVGTIMFECMIGWPPFCGQDNEEVYKKIVSWRQYLLFPPDSPLAEEPEDFMRCLMCDVNDRLGSGGRGAAEIKAHPFFRGVEWHALRRIRAPFEPKLSSNIDTQYFPDDIPQHDTTAAVRARDAGNEDAAEMSLPFIGYTFKRFDAFRSG